MAVGASAQPADVDRLFDTVTAEAGMLTGLVNNAGATAHVGDLADTPVEVIRQVLDLNLLGPVLCARRAAQVMSTSRGGRGGVIVNVSSAAATLGSAHEYVHYAAAGDPGRPDRVAARIPLGRAGEVEEIAAAIGWLLGTEASFVTGATLRVAGGL